MSENVLELITSKKVTKDIIKASETLGREECRYLVDLYYQMQDFRIATNNQIRSIVKSDIDEPHETIAFFANSFETIENNIKKVLKKYVESQEIGRWLLSITGVGEIISAGLLSNLDIEVAKTAGAFWAYCGLDPNREWLGREKAKKMIEESLENKKLYEVEDFAVLGQKSGFGMNYFVKYFSEKTDKNGKKFKPTKENLIKALAIRPFNSRLKTLQWKIGESFVKVQNNDNDIYGKIYVKRKVYEQTKNDNLEYKVQAEEKLRKYNISKSTDAYKCYSQGMLPPAHIQSRAKRYAVRIFLSHFFDTWYRLHYKQEPPKPFAIAILNHTHMIEPPEITK